ncbi:Uncharacterised protein [Vibrio cholerae]|nr:Uncharacterised protein [Vibrio cholerae]
MHRNKNTIAGRQRINHHYPQNRWAINQYIVINMTQREQCTL